MNLLLMLIPSIQGSSQISFALDDREEILLFQRYLESQKCEPGFVTRSTTATLNLDISSASLMKLKTQFNDAFHIDLDTKKNGRFVKSFTEFKVNFDVSSHWQRSGILGARSPVGQAWRSLLDSHEVTKGDTLKSVKYYIRPWIDSNGDWTQKTEGQFLILRKNHEILIKF